MTTCWSLLVSSCRCFDGSPASLLFRCVFLILLLLILEVSIPSPWFSASIGSPVSLATGSPFGSSRYQPPLDWPRCLGLGVFLFLPLGFWSDCQSLLKRCLWCFLPFSFSLWRGFLLVVASASFGTQIPFAMWSPCGTSQGLLVPLSRSGLGGSLCVVVSSWFVSALRLVLWLICI